MRKFTWILGFLGGMCVVAFGAYAAFADKIENWGAGVGVAGIVLVGAWLWLDRDELAKVAAAKGARYTLTAVITVVLALGVGVAANVLGDRYDKRWDVTSSGIHTLSAQTVSVLQGLDREVEVVAFFPGMSMEEQNFKDLSAGYQEHSTLLKVRFHDALREPMVAQEYKITSGYGTVVLKSGDKTQRLENEFGEEALTNALIRMQSSDEHKICFVEGHGEADPDDDRSAMGIGGAVIKLEGQNYTAAKVLLAREGRVPADCEVLVAVAPQVDWLPAEREMVAAYVAGGGSFVAMLELAQAPQLAADMARYGFDLRDDLIIETDPSNQMAAMDPTVVMLTPQSFSPHPITEPIKGMVVMQLSRSVSALEGAAGVEVQELARSSAYSWAESDLTVESPQPDEGVDLIGNVPIMAVAEVVDPAALLVGKTRVEAAEGQALEDLLQQDPPEDVLGDDPPPVDGSVVTADGEVIEPVQVSDTAVERKAGGKVVVFGDANFVGNQLVDQGNNMDLFLNTVAWLVGEEDQVSIRPNEATAGTLSMNVLEGLLVWLLALLIVPGVSILGAIATWRIRRTL